MDKLEFRGPFKFEGESSIFNDIRGVISGVYLWCVKNDDDSFRVYYVGEAVDIKQRMLTHLKNLLEGKYTGHRIESLKNNIQIIMHRAGEGMIPRFSDMDRVEFNKDFAANLYLFYAPLPLEGDKNEDKWLRCRFETGIAIHIQNQGQNIISVGHLRYWQGEKKKVRITSSSNQIEALSNYEVVI